MNCDRARQLTNKLIGAFLEPGEERDLREHAAGCPVCAAALKRAEAFIAVMVDSFQSVCPPKEFKGEIVEILREEPLCWPARGFWSNYGWKLATAAALLITAALLWMLARSTGRDLPGKLHGSPKGPAEGSPIVKRLLRGSAQIRRTQGGRFVTLSAGSKLSPGDALRVSDSGPAEISLSDRVSIIVDAGSELTVSPDPALPFDVHLSRGRLFAEVRPGTPFRVLTELGRVRSLGTKFTVSLHEPAGAGRGLGVNVQQGVVEVSAAGRIEKVKAGECLFLGGGNDIRCFKGVLCGTEFNWVQKYRERNDQGAFRGGGGEAAESPDVLLPAWPTGREGHLDASSGQPNSSRRGPRLYEKRGRLSLPPRETGASAGAGRWSRIESHVPGPPAGNWGYEDAKPPAASPSSSPATGKGGAESSGTEAKKSSGSGAKKSSGSGSKKSSGSGSKKSTGSGSKKSTGSGSKKASGKSR